MDCVCLIGQHPGLTAAQFAALFWPRLLPDGPRKPARLAAEILGKLRRKRILLRRIEPTNYYKGGTTMPRFRYYLTDFGYAVYDDWQRQR